MRKVGAFSKEVRALAFIEELSKKHITALIEDDEGSYAIWVHDEGHISAAKSLFDAVNDGKIQMGEKSRPPTAPMDPRIKMERVPKDEKSPIAFKPLVTKLTLFACAFVFVMAGFQSINRKEEPTRLADKMPPIAKALLIDYPENDAILDQLNEEFGKDRVKSNSLPESTQPLIKKFNAYIPWVGIYNIILQPKEVRDRLWEGALFGDIKRGEIWRVFTPAILHLTLLHFLFNILWLSLLGKMIEYNMGRIRFALFILITGVLSNLCQYFMTGPFFMGISGVLSACIGYVYIRKKIAPWEVYLLGKDVIRFFMIFILGFLGLQVVAFCLQYFNLYIIPISIANTGHVSGLLLGMFLAKTGVISRKL